jgi:hypothetical protein
MPHQHALHALHDQLVDLPDDALDELLDQVLEERCTPVDEDEAAIDDERSGTGRPIKEVEESVRTANQIAATLEDSIQREYGDLTEDALRSMLLALCEIWLRRYWGHPQDGIPLPALQALLKTLEPEISLLARPLIARAKSKLN